MPNTYASANIVGEAGGADHQVIVGGDDGWLRILDASDGTLVSMLGQPGVPPNMVPMAGALRASAAIFRGSIYVQSSGIWDEYDPVQPGLYCFRYDP